MLFRKNTRDIFDLMWNKQPFDRQIAIQQDQDLHEPEKLLISDK